MFRSILTLTVLIGVAGCTTAGGGGPPAFCASSGAAVAGGAADCVTGTAAQQRDAMLTQRAVGFSR